MVHIRDIHNRPVEKSADNYNAVACHKSLRIPIYLVEEQYRRQRRGSFWECVVYPLHAVTVAKVVVAAAPRAREYL